MKKFIMALVCLMTMVVFSSCGSTYEVTANYDVCYPDGTRTEEGTIRINNCNKYTTFSVDVHSFGGTNYVSAYRDGKADGHFKSSTAPMRVNSWDVIKTKSNRNLCEAVTKSGKKCNAIAEKGKKYCWEHRLFDK